MTIAADPVLLEALVRYTSMGADSTAPQLAMTMCWPTSTEDMSRSAVKEPSAPEVVAPTPWPSLVNVTGALAAQPRPVAWTLPPWETESAARCRPPSAGGVGVFGGGGTVVGGSVVGGSVVGGSVVGGSVVGGAVVVGGSVVGGGVVGGSVVGGTVVRSCLGGGMTMVTGGGAGSVDGPSSTGGGHCPSIESQGTPSVLVASPPSVLIESTGSR